MLRLGRIVAAALGAVWLIGASAAAQCIEAPDLAAYQHMSPADIAQGATRYDRIGRVVAPVLVNGQGPYRFVVDTGANRSAISDSLALQLGLTPVGSSDVHSVHGVTTVPVVDVDSLRYERLALGSVSMPVLSGRVLAGEHGLLGVDGMRGRRMRLDFERNCIEIVPAEGARRLRGDWVTIRGELRFGHLVVIRGRVGSVNVNLLLDTGSDSTLANTALQEALRARVRHARPREADVAYTAGEPVILDRVIFLPRMSVERVDINNVTAFVGDFHIFRLWDLLDEPAMLVGMDVLAQTRSIAIDYSRGTVQLRLRPEVRTGSRLARY